MRPPCRHPIQTFTDRPPRVKIRKCVALQGAGPQSVRRSSCSRLHPDHFVGILTNVHCILPFILSCNIYCKPLTEVKLSSSSQYRFAREFHDGVRLGVHSDFTGFRWRPVKNPLSRSGFALTPLSDCSEALQIRRATQVFRRVGVRRIRRSAAIQGGRFCVDPYRSRGKPICQRTRQRSVIGVSRTMSGVGWRERG